LQENLEENQENVEETLEEETLEEETGPPTVIRNKQTNEF